MQIVNLERGHAFPYADRKQSSAPRSSWLLYLSSRITAIHCPSEAGPVTGKKQAVHFTRLTIFSRPQGTRSIWVLHYRAVTHDPSGYKQVSDHRVYQLKDYAGCKTVDMLTYPSIPVNSCRAVGELIATVSDG